MEIVLELYAEYYSVFSQISSRAFWWVSVCYSQKEVYVCFELAPVQTR